MNKEEYKKLLYTKEWQNKRAIILKRDGHKCVKCNSKKSLHVHHTYYIVDKMPWEVPDDCLMTICNICHKKEHKGKSIQSFIRKTPPKKRRKRKGKISQYVDSIVKNLSKKDRELQEKYDKIKNKFA